MRGTFPAMRPSPEEGGTSCRCPRRRNEVVDSFGAGATRRHAGPIRRSRSSCATRDRAAFLPDLLEALAGQTMETSRFEVVVVDDGSTDGTWPALEALAETSTLRLRGLRLGPQRRPGSGPQHRRASGAGRASSPSPTTTASRSRRGSAPSPDPFSAGERAPHVVVQGRTEGWPEDDRHGPWARTVWVLRPTWLFETCNVAVPPLRRRDSPAGSQGETRRRAVPTASWSVRTPSSAGESIEQRSAAAFRARCPGPPPPLARHLSGVAARPSRAAVLPGSGPTE